MPIPLLVWGAAIGASALLGAVKVGSAALRIREAKDRYARSRNSYDELIAVVEDKHKHVSDEFDELGRIRLDAMVLLGDAVAFLETEGSLGSRKPGVKGSLGFRVGRALPER
mgnify:CR=1 FL=1